MHFVSALDTVPQMRAILTLFEGVATGAADGYARMAEQPAATLLHLGPGLGNGLANLHNARKGKVPIVNIVGDHATCHAAFDAQLQSDRDRGAKCLILGADRQDHRGSGPRRSRGGLRSEWAARPGRDIDAPSGCFMGRRRRARRIRPR